MGKKKIDTGLQKLTDSDVKLRRLLKRKHLSKADVKTLTSAEKVRLGELTKEILNKLKDVDYDAFYEKVQDLFTEDTRNAFWERNHTGIVQVIAYYLNTSSRLPSVSEISDTVGLSRTTVYKHLSEFADHPIYAQEFNKYRILAGNVMNAVYRNAVNGDTGAQKLYFSVMGHLGNKINNQTNYIQINGLTIDQATIQRLQPEQLAIIEGVLKSVTNEENNTLI